MIKTGIQTEAEEVEINNTDAVFKYSYQRQSPSMINNFF